MEKEKVWQYYKERMAWTDAEGAEVAETMCFLKREMPDFPDETLYALAYRIFEVRKSTVEPFLSEELNDTMRYILQEGLSSWGGCDVGPEHICDFLLQCSEELFEYIMEYEGAENQGRFQVDYPDPWPEEQLQNEVETVLNKIGA